MSRENYCTQYTAGSGNQEAGTNFGVASQHLEPSERARERVQKTVTGKI